MFSNLEDLAFSVNLVFADSANFLADVSFQVLHQLVSRVGVGLSARYKCDLLHLARRNFFLRNDGNVWAERAQPFENMSFRLFIGGSDG